MTLLLVNCADKTAKESDVTYSDAQVFLHDKPYTGEVWSEDGVTWCMTATDGTPTSFTLYHTNGTAAFVMQSPADTLQAFDDQGTPIAIDSFAIHYKELAGQIPALLARLNGQPADTTTNQP